MTNDSKRTALIEEATAGLAAFDAYWGDGGPVAAAYGRPWGIIRGMLAVFEQAHTFTPGRYVDVVFDGPPEAESGRFVEVENEAGESIRFGEWVERDGGFWALRIEQAHTPTDDEVEAKVIEEIKLAAHVMSEAMVFQGDTYPVKAIPYSRFLNMLEGFRRPVQGEPGEHGGTIPLYGMLDVWMALYGASHPEFDEFYAEHGYDETWSRILAAVRERRPVQGEPTDAQRHAQARLQARIHEDHAPHFHLGQCKCGAPLGDSIDWNWHLTGAALRAAAAVQEGEQR